MLRSVPPVLTWSIFAAERKTAVGPRRSAPWTGEIPSERGLPRLPAVGRRPCDRPEVDVTGRREHLEAVRPSPRARPPVDRREGRPEDADHQVVGRVVVVPVLGHLVHEALPERLRPGEVGVHRPDERLERHRLLLEDEAAERGEGIGDRPDPDGLDERVVVARAAGVVVAPLRDAVVRQDREERRRHLGRVEALDELVAPDLHLDEVSELRLERPRRGRRSSRTQPRGRSPGRGAHRSADRLRRGAPARAPSRG